LKPRTALAVGTLAFCAGTIQWHSLAWWVDQVGWSGVGFSLGLELYAAWAWTNRGRHWAVAGAVASAVALAGPLHHIGAPVWQQYQQARAQQTAVTAELSSLRQQIATQRETLQGYRERSEDRLGWRDVQERASARLQELRDRERALLAERARLAGAGPAGVELVTLIMLLALPLLQTGTVATLRYLSAHRRAATAANTEATAPDPAPAPTPRPKPATAAPAFARDRRDEIAHRLWQHMDRNRLSQPQIAQALSDEERTIPRPEVTRLVNHSKYQERGESRLASNDTFARAERYLQEQGA
jgi:hypothetical protein